MKIKKKRVLSNEPGRSNFRVGRGRSRQKFVKNFFVRGKKKRGIIFHDPLNYIIIRDEMIIALHNENCCWKRFLSIRAVLHARKTRAHLLLFVQRYWCFFTFVLVVWTFFTMNHRRGEKEIFPNEFAICVFILDRIFSIVAHDRFDFTGR